MKENKKGFTLIELLAVLVVLAILALIAVPIVLNIINQAREKARLRSVEGFAKAVESEVYTYMMDNPNVNIGDIDIYDVSSSGLYYIKVGTSVNQNYKINYSGQNINHCVLDNSVLVSSNKIVIKNCDFNTYKNGTLVRYKYENGKADYYERGN